MSLLLIVTAPLWYLFIVSLYPVPSRGWRGLLMPFLGGLVLGMAALSVTLSLLTRTPFGVELGRLYWWAWFRGPGWSTTVGVVLMAVLFLPKPTSFSRIREMTGWLAGMTTTYLVWHALSPMPGFDDYRVFFMPFVWMLSMGGAVWLTDRGLRFDGIPRYLLLISAFLFPSILTFLPVLYTSGEIPAAWLIVLPLAGVSAFLSYLDSRGRLG
ncbi:MAG: hypothetical protein RQ801_08770 [Spirochaetaceae bacterium]|nr:hypothetical protein [Spirochaetaceae bacterium]MDT8298377.1 hypothetical protein [Spirochaetaceae bacterium]